MLKQLRRKHWKPSHAEKFGKYQQEVINERFFIRKATEKDLESLYQIEVSATRLYVRAGFNEAEVTPRSLENLTRLLNETKVFNAENSKGVAMGYVSFRLYGSYFHLEEISVTEAFRNKGIGRALLCFYIESGANHDACKGYSLTVFNKAIWAVNLYKNAGFRPLNQMRDFPCPEVVAQIIEQDRKAGLDISQRTTMIKLIREER
jgi:ribosomal protein S18 acetylase RimI-like enzyme